MVKKETERDRQSAKKRAMIYQAAVELFKTYGYEQTTVDDIAAAVGMSKGSVYHFYPQKIDMLHFFFQEVSGKGMRALDCTSSALLQRPAQAILDYCVGIATAYDQIGYDLSIYLQNVYAERSRESGMDPHTFVSDLEAFVAAAQQAGTFDDGVSAREAANIIHTAAAGIFRKWILDGGKYASADANRWFMPRILNTFVPEKARIPSAACPY